MKRQGSGPPTTLSEIAKPAPAGVKRQDASALRCDVRWLVTGDPVRPYQAKVGDETWVVQLNDFPEEHLYTLFIDGKEPESFDDWPVQWSRPGRV